MTHADPAFLKLWGRQSIFGRENVMKTVLYAEKEDIQKMISSVNWHEYETAYGNAGENIPYFVPTGDDRGYTPKVEISLTDLFSDDKETALKAAHDLWCGLCHQYAFVSSAALPSFDILCCALQNPSDEIKIEILDIFNGFACCTSGYRPDTWQGMLRNKLENLIPYLQTLIGHPNEDIAYFAEEIIKELE